VSNCEGMEEGLKRKEPHHRRGKKKKKSKRQKIPTTEDTSKESVEDKNDMEPLVESVKEKIASAGPSEGTLSDWLNPSHPTFWKDLKDNWSRVPKKTRGLLAIENNSLVSKQSQEIIHPFFTTSDDHCETAPEAYSDIACILKSIALKLNKTPKDLAIYDPFYCNGAVVRNLSSLGFDNVYNQCEDFYSLKSFPQHDVLLTNPPYSADHLQHLMKFAKSNNKPCLLLMPNYVYGKSYYEPEYNFVIPKRRYFYWTPKGLRPKDKTQNHVSALGIRTSPFVSFWYINVSSLQTADDLKKLYKSQGTCYFAENYDEIPQGVALKTVKE